VAEQHILRGRIPTADVAVATRARSNMASSHFQLFAWLCEEVCVYDGPRIPCTELWDLVARRRAEETGVAERALTRAEREAVWKLAALQLRFAENSVPMEVVPKELGVAEALELQVIKVSSHVGKKMGHRCDIQRKTGAFT
jgi:hypothetical protein